MRDLFGMSERQMARLPGCGYRDDPLDLNIQYLDKIYPLIATKGRLSILPRIVSKLRNSLATMTTRIVRQ